jgi:hypothetical protein
MLNILQVVFADAIRLAEQDENYELCQQLLDHINSSK